MEMFKNKTLDVYCIVFPKSTNIYLQGRTDPNTFGTSRETAMNTDYYAYQNLKQTNKISQARVINFFFAFKCIVVCLAIRHAHSIVALF